LDEPSLLGRFVLFNAVPSSIISGVVHFIGFLILALLTIPPPVMRRFHGAVDINPQRSFPALEQVIEADAEAGVPDTIVRDVTENSRTLKFRSAGFEEA